MAVEGEVLLDVSPDLRGFDRELSSGVKRSADQAERKLTSSFRDTATKAAGAFATGFAARKIVDLLAGTVDAASDLAEAQNKVDVVFKDSAATVRGFASGASDALGQSERQALEASGTFGNLFTSMGLARDVAAEMSTTLVTLASDLASFNNVRPDDALIALRAGLVGEQEPLRRFGINLNEATLRAEALRLGLEATTAVLDPAVKAQAAYSLILQQSTNAQGDFVRTSDELANMQRIVTAQLEDFRAELGAALLPVIKDATGVLSSLFSGFNALPDPVKEAATEAAAFTLAAAALAAGLKALELGLASAGVQVGIFGRAVKSVPLVALFAAQSKATSDLREKTDEYGKGLVANEGLLIRWGKSLLGLDTDKAASETEELAAESLRLMEIQTAAASAVDGFQGSIGAVNDELEKAITNTREFRDAQLALSGGLIGVLQASDDAREAQRKLNELRREGKTNTQEYRDAEFDAVLAVLGLKEEIRRQAHEMDEAGVSAQNIKDKLLSVGREAGLTKNEITTLIREGLDKLPAAAASLDPLIARFGLTEERAAAARAAVDGFVGALGNVPSGGGGGGGGGGGDNNGGGGGRTAPPPNIRVQIDGRDVEQANRRRRTKVGGL